MSTGFYISIIGIPLMLHIALAFFYSKEVSYYPLFNPKQKIVWHLVVWLFPIIGSIILNRHLKLGWGSGEPSTGGDTYQCGGSGTSSELGGGDSGGGD